MAGGIGIAQLDGARDAPTVPRGSHTIAESPSRARRRPATRRCRKRGQPPTRQTDRPRRDRPLRAPPHNWREPQDACCILQRHAASRHNRARAPRHARSHARSVAKSRSDLQLAGPDRHACRAATSLSSAQNLRLFDIAGIVASDSGHPHGLARVWRSSQTRSIRCDTRRHRRGLGTCCAEVQVSLFACTRVWLALLRF